MKNHEKKSENFVTIVFEPDGNKHTIRPRISVFEAAIRSGNNLRSECGGKGKCGKCRIIVKEKNALTELTKDEMKLERQDRQTDRVLNPRQQEGSLRPVDHVACEGPGGHHVLDEKTQQRHGRAAGHQARIQQIQEPSAARHVDHVEQHRNGGHHAEGHQLMYRECVEV